MDPIDYLQQQVNESSQTIVARWLGISVSYLSRILSGERQVGKQLAARLGYRRVVSWELLPGPEGADRPLLVKVQK